MRDPTSCPWSPNSVCSSVDLSKLHIDQPEPGRTDIKVSGETLTMKGSGNLDLWTRSRAGAPVAWSDAPTDDTYTFEVDCRVVLGGGTLISVVSVYDGPDGAYNFPFTVGPRTWSGNGVGIQNMGLQDYVRGPANKGFGEDPLVWHRLRVVRRPGVVFNTAYRHLDGSDWVQVRSGMMPSHFKANGTRIALGLKQGGSTGEIEFRNLVVYGGEPKSCPYRRDAPNSVDWHCQHYTGYGVMTFMSLVQHLPKAWESPSRENSQGSGRRTVPHVSER